MSVAVVYYSKYGTTEQYARWISEETGADLLDARKCKIRDLSGYDTIVYGGGIYAGGIKGIELITKNWSGALEGKKVLVFAVGITVEDEANRQQCMEINFEKRLISWISGDEAEPSSVRELLSQKMMPVTCFFLPGAYDPGKIRGLDKGIMALTKKMMDGGASGASVTVRNIAGYIENGCDLVDRSRIAPIVEAVKEVENGSNL